MAPTQLSSTVETADIDLVSLARKGDTSAFERLYRRHIGRVYAVCLRIAADSGRAEDLAQETFVRVWEVLDTFRGESAFPTWLHRIAVNTSLAYLRSAGRRGARFESSDDLDNLAGAHPPSHPGEAIDLEEAIRALPPQARAIFVLHDIEGYKHEEIGELMGLAAGTSKAQLHRARKLLKESLR